MRWYDSIRNRIESANTSTYRTQDGGVAVRRSSFSALSLSLQKEINQIVEDFCLRNIKEYYGRNLDTLDDVIARAEQLIPAILNNPINVNRVKDMMGYRDILAGVGNPQGGLTNSMWLSGVNGADPAKANHIRPNLYISPGEAASIFSNEGLPKRIIAKKAKTILLNGIEIKNSQLSKEQLEKVNEGMQRTGLQKAVADGLRDALVYGGGILYPMFKHDTPLSMTMPVEQLAKFGVVKRDCISRFVSLDRWNTTHFPSWNPTAADFLKPQYFYIPFLGCDVHSSRIARIVPAPQAGYWGVMMTVGWGVSDFTGWIESVFNYNNVMQAIPSMLQQMSILARTFNVDGPLATEGAMVMDEVTANQTIRVRETSPLNPINLDVIGELKAIDRNFSQVPELTKLIRQDVAAKAGLREQSIFTVEKKGMSGSGGEFADVREQEHEALQVVYADIQEQCKPLAMLQIINELGLDRDVLKALPYTEMRFDKHVAVTVDQRNESIKNSTKGVFDLIAGGIPLPDAADMMSQLSGGLFSIDSDLRKRLEERQERLDQMEDETHDAEIEGMEAQAESAMLSASSTTTTETKSTSPDGKKSTSSSTKVQGGGGGHSYDSPLRQRQKEKVGSGSGTKKQGLSKARAKKQG